ncbi:MAG: endonuclease/exonuclease/phosphatase family protein, partial [Pseudomonadota bacterium]
DFTPGDFIVRLENSAGTVVTELEITYVISIFNDQDRGNSLNFSWSLDNSNYTAVPGLDFTSPEIPDPKPAWSSSNRNTTLMGLNLNPGDPIFLRWTGSDLPNQGGSRDEFAIDDIQVTTPSGTPSELAITASGPANANAGDSVVYAITIENESTTSPMIDLALFATLPTGLSYVSDTSGTAPSVLSVDMLEWDFGTLAAEDSIVFDITLDSDGGITNGSDLSTLFEVIANLDGNEQSDSDTVETTFSNSDPVEIFTIQGEGERSPFAPPTGGDDGDTVTTENNVVTAVAGNGFFMQMPDDRDSSSLPLASRGLFVFTDSAPAVAVGDLVDVTGPVVEFFNLTQIGNPDSVSVVSSGSPLPAPITLDATLPSPNPESLSCVDSQFECYENMYVTLPNGYVTAPSQSFGSAPVAEAFISADGERILRGEGEAFPGVDGCATCPVWTGAPELFEMDPRRFDLRSEPLAGGTTFNATGVMGFSFGDYVLWPSELNITSEPSLPDAINNFDSNSLTIGSLNALNLFDDDEGPARAIEACGSTDNAVDREELSETDYAAKLNKLATYIVTGLGGPDVLAIQEVESTVVLQDLADEIEALDPSLVYTPRLEFGNDQGNINNGYLINEARIQIDSVVQLAADECLTLDNSPLHDRPPLLLRGTFIGNGATWPFAVYNLHMRSLGGIANADGRTRLKRHTQAQSVATLVQELQTTEPDLPIVVIGDMNAFEFSDGYADVVGHLLGSADPSQNLVSQENQNEPNFSDNIPNPPLRLPLLDLPETERYSFIFNGVSQALDHAIVDDTAERVLTSLEYSRANADYWEGFEFDFNTEAYASDHDGLVITLVPGLLFADGFEND